MDNTLQGLRVDSDMKSLTINEYESQRAYSEHGGRSADTSALEGALAEVRSYVASLAESTKQQIKSLRQDSQETVEKMQDGHR